MFCCLYYFRSDTLLFLSLSLTNLSIYCCLAHILFGRFRKLCFDWYCTMCLICVYERACASSLYVPCLVHPSISPVHGLDTLAVPLSRMTIRNVWAILYVHNVYTSVWGAHFTLSNSNESNNNTKIPKNTMPEYNWLDFETVWIEWL